MNCKIILILFLTFIFYCTASGQIPVNNFINYNTDNDLNSNYVNSIIQDSKGFLWIGTSAGLNKFDGYSFKSYKNNPHDTHSISNNLIKSIIEDKSGNLWIGTWGGGLNMFDRNTEKFQFYKNNPGDNNSLSNNFIETMCADDSGNLWIGTKGDGLNFFSINKKEFEHYRHNNEDSNSLISDIILSVSYIGNSKVAVCTDKGMEFLDITNKNFVPLNKSANYTINEAIKIRTVYAEDSVIWIGTFGKGFLKYYPGKEVFESCKIPCLLKQNPEYPSSINFITADNNNNLWLATSGGSEIVRYNKFNGESDFYVNHTAANRESDVTRINTVFIDKSNILWAGTWINGLDKIDLNKKKFEFYRINTDSSLIKTGKNMGKNIWSVYQDKNENIWLGTNYGLKKFDRETGTYKSYYKDKKNPYSISSNNISSIVQDDEGFLWVGTWGGGINVFDEKNEKFSVYKNDATKTKGLSSNYIRTLFKDRDGNIWIGTGEKGVNIFNNEDRTFKLLTHNDNDTNSLSSDDIIFINEDNSGDIWMGSYEGGLNRYERSSGTVYRYNYNGNNNGINSNTVLSSCLDNNGVMWFGTTNGLDMFDRASNTFYHYTEADGLPDNIINSILNDNTGNLWLATNNGISKFDTDKKKFRNYTVLDGLQGKLFCPSSSIRCKNGEYLFGGVNGFNILKPDEITDKENLSRVMITSFSIFNKPVNTGEDISSVKEIVLNYTENVFSFDFSSLDFTNPSMCQYEYKMEGLDNDWQFQKNSHTAYYSHVEPGEYNFLVKATNSDGIWSKPTSLLIVIKPPFWQTLWFRSVVLVLFVSVVLTGYRRKVKKYIERGNELETRVEERTFELVNSNVNLQNEIRERLKTEESLKKSEEQYKALVENSHESIIVVQDGMIVFANPRTILLFNYTLDEILTTPFYEFVHPDDTDLIDKNLIKRPSSMDSLSNFTVRIINKDLKTFTIDINTFPILWNDMPATLNFLNDITLRKKADDDILKALNKEKELSELRSRFILMASHEFRTPLTSINTSAEILEKFGITLTGRQKKKNLLRIKENVKQMANLLNDVLLIGKSDAGKIELKPEPVKLQTLCEQTIEELKAIAVRKTGHTIKFEGFNLQQPVFLDYKFIKQMLNNLISNAIKYSPDNSVIEFHTEIKNNKIMFIIKDNGIGIPKESRKQIFEPFYRGNNTGEVTGTGLGLAIVKRAVELHKGKINIKSKINSGTEIKISIPITK